MSEIGEIKLKLLINQETNKVIFAEASKEFVDFLLGFMQMPLGYILRLFNQSSGEMGLLSLGNIYSSVEALEASYLQQSQLRNSILNPIFSFDSEIKLTPLLRGIINGGSNTDSSSSTHSFNHTPSFVPQSSYSIPNSSPFGCKPFDGGRNTNSFGSFNFDSSSSILTSSLSSFKPSSSLTLPSSASEINVVDGYVKGAVTYMVMDDLTIKPSSTISLISMLNCKGIKDMSSLREKLVLVDGAKGLEIVKAAFQSSTVLTDVFISKDANTANPTT